MELQDERSVSVEELARLQEEMLAVKMQNHDLEQANRRARVSLGHGASGGGMAGAQAAAAAAAAQLSSSAAGVMGSGLGAGLGNLSQQLKVGAGAVSALGARGAAQLRSSLAEAAADAANLETEVFFTEVEPLRQKLREAQDELSSAKKSAMAAQHRAATVSNKSPELKLPSVEDLRRRLEETGEVTALDGDDLMEIVEVALRIDEERRKHLAAKRFETSAPIADVDPRVSPILQIQKQQEDIERVRDAIEKQSGQIGRLADQAAHDKAVRPDSVQSLQERIAETERYVSELSRQLEESEGVSSSMYELKCHFKVLQERVQRRQRAIEDILERQGELNAEEQILREHAGMAENDAISSHVELLTRSEAAANTFESECADGNRDPNAQAEQPCCDDAFEIAHLVPEPPVPQMEDVGVQVDAPSFGSGGESPSHRRMSLDGLKQTLEDLQAEKSAFERRNLGEVQKLRAIARGCAGNSRTFGSQQLSAVEATGSSSAADHGSVVDTISICSGTSLLYRHKLQELTALKDGLDRDIDLLRSSEECMAEDTQEKAAIIRNLMRAVHADDDAFLNVSHQHSRKDAGHSLGVVAAGVLRNLLGKGQSDQQGADTVELERIAEQGMLDNLRLRRDFKQIGEELQKTFATQSPCQQ